MEQSFQESYEPLRYYVSEPQARLHDYLDPPSLKSIVFAVQSVQYK